MALLAAGEVAENQRLIRRDPDICSKEKAHMNSSLIAWRFADPRTKRLLGRESTSEEPAAFWRINGYRARLLVWTRDEWERLETPPSDAQYHPTGVWCALRLD
jgi:hypothetical protein